MPLTMEYIPQKRKTCRSWGAEAKNRQKKLKKREKSGNPVFGKSAFLLHFVIFESVEMPGNRSPTWSTKNILVSLDKLIYGDISCLGHVNV